MNKGVIVGIVVLVVVLAGGGFVLANHKSKDDSSSKTSSSDMSSMHMSESSTSSSSSSNSSASTATNAVTIENFAYSPASISVKVGDTVTWTNKDSAAHTVTTTDGPESFDSGSVAQGQTFTHTFTKAGTYKYHCTFHPSMPTATITVTAS